MGMRGALLCGLAAAAAVLAAAVPRRLRAVEVTGDSMLPGLRPGDWLLVRVGARPVPGDVVVARHPERPELLIVKRAVRADGGGWWLESDNQAAAGRRDSWDFGAVPDRLVAGRVVARYWPLSRAGTVTRGAIGLQAAVTPARPAQRPQQ
ncbi:nickel-type superoxide dismutase maturation protease [Actinomadura livida]|uniref:Nickel-type superoxide dismutase maturation protease n=1 Tax=Actinomadura livida TaxID=79909 RepID=A0A7W7N0I9_9ACTN|nr:MULTISPECIES: nickel-type superoxide dismutase maturation protease [Actinomadura]MBB4777139.1 nickel-type superoxide dismutase maturation protease [Actinomadura catellatispora]GGU21427.1 S26 family signal peptidase [Actinomadura livida]